MKKLLFVLLSLACSATAFTQGAASLVGKWSGAFSDADGKPLPFTLSISADTYQIDMGSDGTTDISGGYTSDGKQITIWDTAGQNTCPSDQKGVYSIAMDGDTVTFTKVSDACPGRGGAPLVVKRM